MTKSVLVGRIVPTAGKPAVCLFLLCGLLGCGGGGGASADKNPRVSASGKVEFDGKPLPAGTVTFLHHTTGHLAVCEIDDGYYQNASGEGPNTGSNTLTIMGQASAEGYPMWQKPWTKTVEVGSSDFSEDFSIKSDEVEALDPSTIEVDE